ncbi:hypothetical protein DM860_003388 [Cuscuta australis]|uniref:Uncharacterized protein n=1 Tax=Cuscuta australis TaxID=267555 RepID=A0A328DJY5_9ASTE|nr:hypothetical protein DM860_003388 [Cuscuta australis]
MKGKIEGDEDGEDEERVPASNQQLQALNPQQPYIHASAGEAAVFPQQRRPAFKSSKHIHKPSIHVHRYPAADTAWWMQQVCGEQSITAASISRRRFKFKFKSKAAVTGQQQIPVAESPSSSIKSSSNAMYRKRHHPLSTHSINHSIEYQITSNKKHTPFLP